MVSIREVAKQAGVAISTVSKVLNGYPNISEETKAKVHAAIAELNYIPNSIASALSSKQFGRVALLLNPARHTRAIDQIFMQYIVGALDKAKELNVEVVTIFTTMIEGMSADELTRYLMSQSISGLILYGMSKEDMVFQQLVERREFACVLVDAPLVNEKTSYVGIDHEAAQYEVAKRTILEDHCQSVLYIAGRRDGYVTDLRIQGMEKLAQELGFAMQIEYGEFSELAARRLTLQYAAAHDAVICASDLMAIGAMNGLIDMDIFRPVCGFDGIALMGYVGKQMNTLKQDFYEISSRALEEVRYLMNGGTGRSVCMPYHIVKMHYEDIIC